MPTIELRTDITGTVWKVLKAVGDAIAEDEPVAILESMKMEIPITSPEAGVVKEVLVKENDVVSDGGVIARVDV